MLHTVLASASALVGTGVVATNTACYLSRSKAKEEVSSTHTFIARDLRANDVADLAAGGEICDCMHARKNQPSRPRQQIYDIVRSVAAYRSNQSKHP